MRSLSTNRNPDSNSKTSRISVRGPLRQIVHDHFFESVGQDTNKLVPKHSRTIERTDSHRETPASPQMSRLPRDLVAEPEHTRRRAGNDTLACTSSRLEVHVDAQRKIEATLLRRRYQRRELDPAHEPR